MIYDPFPFKRCTKCYEWKPRTIRYFSRYGRANDCLCSQCKTCRAIDRRIWKNNNRERIRNVDKKWVANNPGKVHKANQNWLKQHPEYTKQKNRNYLPKWQENNRDKTHKYNERWRKKNPEKLKALAHRRFARERYLPNTFTDIDWLKVVEHFESICAVCESKPTRLTADHWIPLSDPNCPGTVPWNIIPLCPGCNSSKHDHAPIEWLKKKFGEDFATRKFHEIQSYLDSVKALNHRA